MIVSSLISLMALVFSLLVLTNDCRYSYYTAGSGGAGPTILATSFLLLGEEAVVYVDGKPTLAVSTCFYSISPVCIGCIWRYLQQFNDICTAWLFSGKIQKLKAYSARRDVDFGKGIGTKPVYLLYVLPPLFPICQHEGDTNIKFTILDEGAPLLLFEVIFSLLIFTT